MKLSMLCYFFLICLSCLSLGQAQEVEHLISAKDCSFCHKDGEPTEDNPLLKPCPRMIWPVTVEIQEIVIMDELEDLYVPVRFDHAGHAHMAKMGKGCEICHHYEENVLEPSACKECHPKGARHENIEQPGLKGAYHRQCLGCHTQWEGRNKCEICHAKKKGGALEGEATTYATQSKHEPIKIKELITFETEYEVNDKVPFHHKRHTSRYEQNCDVCHQEQSCTACHVHGEASHPLGELEDIDLHETCFICHEEDTCEHCHGQDPEYRFSHEKTGWPLKSYHADLYCRRCHAQRGAYQELDNQCTSCHEDGWDADEFDHGSITGVKLDEMHAMAPCESCHAKGVGQPATCTECHDDERTYDPKKGFAPEEE